MIKRYKSEWGSNQDWFSQQFNTLLFDQKGSIHCRLPAGLWTGSGPFHCRLPADLLTGSGPIHYRLPAGLWTGSGLPVDNSWLLESLYNPKNQRSPLLKSFKYITWINQIYMYINILRKIFMKLYNENTENESNCLQKRLKKDLQ